MDRRGNLAVSLSGRLGYTSARKTRRQNPSGDAIDMNQPPPKNSGRKLVWFALLLGAMSLFMYVSFIIKTAVKGP